MKKKRMGGRKIQSYHVFTKNPRNFSARDQGIAINALRAKFDEQYFTLQLFIRV